MLATAVLLMLGATQPRVSRRSINQATTLPHPPHLTPPRIPQSLFILERAGLFGTQAGEVYQVRGARCTRHSLLPLLRAAHVPPRRLRR